MIINLSNFGGGGGGGSYVLPIASQSTLGGVKIGSGVNIDSGGTISVTGGTGGGIEVVTELPASGTDGQMVYLAVTGSSGTTMEQYTYSENPILMADIDYTENGNKNGGNKEYIYGYGEYNAWSLRYKYENLPDNTTLAVYLNLTDQFVHIVYENNEIHLYDSNVGSGYTATTYVNVAKNTFVRHRYGNVYWTDDVLVIFNNNSYVSRISFNINDFYRTGWFKNTNHKISNKNYFKDGFYFTGDNEIILKNPEFVLKQKKLMINPAGQGFRSGYVFGEDTENVGPIFAPTTTGQTGYVCVAGNGWTAPTWKNPSTLLNKSTLYGTHSTFIVATDEWKLLGANGELNFDSGNFYIYNTCDFNEVTEIVDFNDATDDGEGGMTEPTKELKVSVNTDGSYDVFYGEFTDYEGGVYSYTASTHLDTVFSHYDIPSEDQTVSIVRMVLRPDGLYCYENNSGCGFVNNYHSTFTDGDSVTIGKMTVFVQFEDTPDVYLSQDEGM